MRPRKDTSILRLLRAMDKGRPSDPRDGTEWDRAIRQAEKSLDLQEGQRVIRQPSFDHD